MKTYHKPKPKRKTISSTAPDKNALRSGNKFATLASTIFFKVASAFAPLNKFQQALYYEGKEHYSKTKKKIKKPFLAQLYQKNAVAFAVVERILFIAFVIFALFTNAYLLLVLPVIGALVFYRNRVKWLWWKFKVFVLFRSFYEHRRNLYKQGTLWHHLLSKRPKIYGSAIIWGATGTVQNQKFQSLQKSKSLTAKEYIHS